MSEDIRMSDVFDLPVEVDMGDEDHLLNIVHVWEDDPDVADLIVESMTSEDSANAIANAINQHDKLTDRVKELEGKLERAEKSLTTSGFVDNGGEYWKPPVNKTAGRVIQNLLNRESELKETLSAAIDFIEKSPCDPDITPNQAEAWLKLENLNFKELIDE